MLREARLKRAAASSRTRTTPSVLEEPHGPAKAYAGFTLSKAIMTYGGEDDEIAPGLAEQVFTGR